MKTKAFIGEGLPVTVYFDYQPYEPPEATYPGCEAQVTINAVEVTAEGDTAACDISDDLNAKCVTQLEVACFEFIRETCRALATKYPVLTV